jgi:hypothetical protein
MNIQHLNPKEFIKHKGNALKLLSTKSGWMHTDAYQFFIGEERIDTDTNRIDFKLQLTAATHECYHFETYFWENGDTSIDLRLQIDLERQIGGVYDYAKIGEMKLAPIIYWINNEGRQCVALTLLALHL